MTKEATVTDESKFFMVLKAAMNHPGVKIDREEFLRKQFKIHFRSDVVNKAIAETPAKAGITIGQLEGIAKSCIKLETNKVSAISFATGLPGGIALIGAIPADITQYFAHIIRILQKLIYLYGWEELYESKDDLDDETLYLLTLFIGIMFGVGTANAAITKIAQSAAVRTEKTLLRKALTQGFIYPIVKKVAAILGFRINKQIFAKAVGKLVPIIGGFVSGGFTYVTFKISSNRLKDYLKTLSMADPDFYHAEKAYYVDVDHVVVEESEEELGDLEKDENGPEDDE